MGSRGQRATHGPMSHARLPVLTIADHNDGRVGGVLRLPNPRTTLLHAVPVVLEAVVVPLAIFYVVLVLTGFRGALIGALCWSLLALARRLYRKERVSMMLLLGTMLLIVRTTIAYITGSAFVYFAQPAAGTIIISLVLFGSAIMKKPFTQRFAGDFCPMDPTLMLRPMVHRFFVRISVLWATVLMLNAGFVLWLLVSSSLHAFVLERSVVTWVLTAGAIYLSIRQFIVMMRGDGITVQWAARVKAEVPVPT
jgi:hypothetical protein